MMGHSKDSTRYVGGVAALVLSLSLSLSVWAKSDSVDAIKGYWVMPDGSALIEITKTPGVRAKDDVYVARIVALREKQFTALDEGAPSGETRRDIHNPDEALRQRPLEGLTIAKGLKYDRGSWSGGRIYDPASGNTYRCKLDLVKEGFLRVRGYLGISLLGRTMYWQKADNFKQQMSQMLDAIPEKSKPAI